jgi:hypothetical protein
MNDQVACGRPSYAPEEGLLMRTFTLSRAARVAVLATLILMLPLAVAVAAAQELILFNGDIQKAGLRLAPWGSGACVADDNPACLYSNEDDYLHSIRVETDGFGIGGRIDLDDPVDLTPFLEAGDGGYLELRVMVAQPVYYGQYQGMMYQPGMYTPGMAPATQPGTPPGMGGMPGMQPGMPPGMGGMPGTQPGMQPGMPPGMGGMPGMQPGMPPGMGGMPGMPGMEPGMPPGMGGMPGMQPGMPPGVGGMPGMQPGMQPGMGGPGMAGMPGGPGMPGMGGMPGGPGMPGMGGPGMGGMPGGGVPGMPGQTTGGYMLTTPTPERLTQIRVLLETDKGTLVSAPQDIDLSTVDIGGWLRFDIPFSQMASAQGEKIQEAKLRRIVLSGDAHIFYMAIGTTTTPTGAAGVGGATMPGMPGGAAGMPGGMPGMAGAGTAGVGGMGAAAGTGYEIEVVYAKAEVPTFYVGQIKLLREDTPLVADAGRDQEGKVGQDITFTAGPQLHNVQARYAWDFDDLDGIGEDALGQTVTWRFPQPGYYTVTLTVTDVAGVMVPKTSTTNVHISK